jgi:hypothetical protein
VLNVVCASVPDTPIVSPVSDATVTNEMRIKVVYGPLTAAQNGGSPVLSYELQMDNGKGGDFASYIGGTAPSLETRITIEENINSGGIFRFRFRAANVQGWSDYSPIAHVKAATTAQRPPAPQFLDATPTSVTVKLL